MFDLNSEEKKESNSAFKQNTPSLPGFSLPTNLNNLVTKKRNIQQQQQQQQQQQLNRPRLAHLRSAWLSQQSIEEDAFAEDKFIDITLPSITNTDNSIDKDGVIGNEISILVTIATGLCLITATVNCIFSTDNATNSIFIGYWTLLLIWHYSGSTQNRTLHLLLPPSSLVMLCYTLWSHNNKNNAFQLCTTLLSSTLFIIAARLSTMTKKLNRESRQHVETYQTHAQEAIDKALGNYSDRRQLFLTTASQEIRDASLMVMATLEQFSPSSILSNNHELLSACSIAVPIASISAINTIIKQACHVTAHLNLVSRLLRETDPAYNTPPEERVKSDVRKEFDVSELIQNVGDALAGMSAKLGVHFALYHTDNGLYYSNVIGDEDAIKHALINLLRNILEGCTPGACIELGLFIAPIPDTPRVKVIFDIIQTASPAIPSNVSAALIPNANFTAQLLSYIDGEMELEDLGKNKTRIEIKLELFPGSNNDQRLLLIEKPSQILEKQLSSIRFSNEPTLEELSSFIKQLKGIKMILHAPEKSVFAKHLTSCLTAWNTDISHVPVLSYSEDDELASADGERSDSDASSAASFPLPPPVPLKTPGASSDSTLHSAQSNNSGRSLASTSSNKVPSPAIEEDHIHSIPPAFILIDDDVLTLEKKLREFRNKPQNTPQPAPPIQRRHRRSKSRNANEGVYGTVAVIFFTSLSNFKRVRDIIHWISSLDLPPYMPRVVVVPKPAAPRRFLTALHTAWNNAVVEPHFIPIATSPLSPFVGQHPQKFSAQQPGTDNSSNGSLATPGIVGPTPISNPLMTPYEGGGLPGPLRFSPGSNRKTAAAAMTGMRVHSPLGMEVEKGNYFFDSPGSSSSNPAGAAAAAAAAAVSSSSSAIGVSSAATAVATAAGPATSGANKSPQYPRPAGPAKLNTSPLLSANTMNNNGMNGGGGLHTPGGIATSPTASAVPSTPLEIKRRLRSHSNTFLHNNGRRSMAELAMSPAMANKPSPVQEETEGEFSGGSNQSSMDSQRPAVTSTATNSSTSTTGDSSTDSVILSPAHAPTSVPVVASPAAMTPSTIPTATTATAATAAATEAPPPDTATKEKEDKSKPAKAKSKLNFKISNRKRKDKTTQSDKPSPPITVLIVEDNMINQAILSTWMKKHSIKFSVACDGKEAVEKWKGGGFHLILMDIQLPVMDGIQATKTIRDIEKERKIGVLPSNLNENMDTATTDTTTTTTTTTTKTSTTAPPSHTNDTTLTTTTTKSSSFQSPVIIVALTASSLESDRQAALAAGCNDFLTKPVSLEWLEQKIMEWGCMQALIDFEGWKKWNRLKQDDSTTTTTSTSKPTTGSKKNATASPKASEALLSRFKKEAYLATGRVTKEADLYERENLAQRTKLLLQDEARGIILMGINKRRVSSVLSDDRPPVQRTKRGSDPDIFSNELSIPKQVEARELKLMQREEERQRKLRLELEGGDDIDDEEDEEEDECT